MGQAWREISCSHVPSARPKFALTFSIRIRNSCVQLERRVVPYFSAVGNEEILRLGALAVGLGPLARESTVVASLPKSALNLCSFVVRQNRKERS